MSRVSPGSRELGELGPYVLQDQIAVGGMAEIYLAKTRGVAGFEKLLCLKVIHPNYADDEHFIGMLIDEAKIAVGLNHANIVQIFDLGKDDKTYFISMEYIDGADLFKVMRRLSEREIDVPIDVAAYIAQEVCTGLDYAHRKRDEQGRPLGIIHRDISPQNILISHSGEVKIVDFGIAKAASRTRNTQAGVIKGKYYYMSPEQAWGDPVDQRTDIFSTGIILYEVLTGQMLYLEEDMHRLLDMVRKADIPRPSTRRPEIPPQLENVVMKALAKRPADRWQTAHEFQAALTNFLFSYAPAFTPSRVAKLLDQALADERAAPEPPAAPRPARPATRQVEVSNLMSRVDYQPETEHSVIFRVSDLLPSPTDEDSEEDRGERTQISGPPQMGDGMMSLAPAAALGTGDGRREWDDDGPTLINRGPSLRPQDQMAEPRPRRKSRAVEVVIPRGTPMEPSHGDLTPTPLMEFSSEPARPLAPRRTPAAVPLPPKPPPVPLPAPANLPRTAPRNAPAPAPPQQQPAQPAWNPGPAQPAWNPGPAQPAWNAAPAQPAWNAAPAQPAWNAAGAQPTWVAPGASPVPVPVGGTLPAQGIQAAPTPLVAAQAWPWHQPAPASATPQPAWAAGAPGSWPQAGSLAALEEPELDAELAAQARRRKRRGRVLLASALVVALLVGSGVALLFLLPPAEEEGKVNIISVPEHASVLFDGKLISKPTPVAIAVADVKRAHTIEVTLKNYKPYQRTLSFGPGEDRRVQVLAVLTPIFGRLDVSSVPPGADAYIDGTHRGTTPVVIDNLSPEGEVNLELRKRGFKPAMLVVHWNGETYQPVRVVLKRASP